MQKRNKRIRKQAVTLIEMMIVILLIGIIGGVLAYNFKGSLDKGKVFKTEQGADQIKNILMMEVAEGKPIEEVIQHWKTVVEASSIVAKPKDLIKDGWGSEYEVKEVDGDIIVSSAKLESHLEKIKKKASGA